MTVTVFRSTDVGAPTLTGATGSLIGVLDACLVNGYGSKSALGWTKAFTGTNRASYQASTGNKLYLDVKDDIAGSSTDWYTAVRGYETMSAVGTGTGLFPTTAQVAADTFYWQKSIESSSATAVSWMLIGNQKTFYLWARLLSTDTAAPNGDNGYFCAFGEFTSFRSSDAYNTIIIGQTTHSSPSTNNTVASLVSAMNVSSTGHYVARSFTQSGTSVTVGKTSDAHKAGGATLCGQTTGVTQLVYPNPEDGGLYIAPVWINESAVNSLRGILPGFWNPLHVAPLVTHDTFTGTGNLAGKTFEGLTTTYSSVKGQVFIETSNTW